MAILAMILLAQVANVAGAGSAGFAQVDDDDDEEEEDAIQEVQHTFTPREQPKGRGTARQALQEQIPDDGDWDPDEFEGFEAPAPPPPKSGGGGQKKKEAPGSGAQDPKKEAPRAPPPPRCLPRNPKCGRACVGGSVVSTIHRDPGVLQDRTLRVSTRLIQVTLFLRLAQSARSVQVPTASNTGVPRSEEIALP